MEESPQPGAEPSEPETSETPGDESSTTTDAPATEGGDESTDQEGAAADA